MNDGWSFILMANTLWTKNAEQNMNLVLVSNIMGISRQGYRVSLGRGATLRIKENIVKLVIIFIIGARS